MTPKVIVLVIAYGTESVIANPILSLGLVCQGGKPVFLSDCPQDGLSNIMHDDVKALIVLGFRSVQIYASINHLLQTDAWNMCDKQKP